MAGLPCLYMLFREKDAGNAVSYCFRASRPERRPHRNTRSRRFQRNDADPPRPGKGEPGCAPADLPQPRRSVDSESGYTWARCVNWRQNDPCGMNWPDPSAADPAARGACTDEAEARRSHVLGPSVPDVAHGRMAVADMQAVRPLGNHALGRAGLAENVSS